MVRRPWQPTWAQVTIQYDQSPIKVLHAGFYLYWLERLHVTICMIIQLLRVQGILTGAGKSALSECNNLVSWAMSRILYRIAELHELPKLNWSSNLFLLLLGTFSRDSTYDVSLGQTTWFVWQQCPPVTAFPIIKLTGSPYVPYNLTSTLPTSSPAQGQRSQHG